ncbi:MAG: hypothetical protein ACTSPM_06280 [Candidatus Heimdallarchaeota archaeon]
MNTIDPDPINHYMMYFRIGNAQGHGVVRISNGYYIITSVTFRAYSNFLPNTFSARIKLGDTILYEGPISSPGVFWSDYEISCYQGFYGSSAPELHVRIWMVGWGESTSHIDSYVDLP